MKNETNKNTIIAILIVIIIILSILVILFATDVITLNSTNNKQDSSNEVIKEEKKEVEVEEENNNESITIIDLYGTYSWEKTYVNENNNTVNLKVKLVLNDDGSATYDESDGYSYEATKGTFIYENNKIIYTKEYFNYNGTNGQDTDLKYTDENNTEVFMILDKNTLQSVYRDQTTSLKK